MNSSSRWVVSNAGSLAARLSFQVPAVLRLGDPGRDFVWGCDGLRLPMGRRYLKTNRVHRITDSGDSSLPLLHHATAPQRSKIDRREKEPHLRLVQQTLDFARVAILSFSTTRNVA